MRVLIFGGTTEGRKLSTALSNAGIDVTLSVATEFGLHLVTYELETQSKPATDGKLTVLSERLGEQEIAVLLVQGNYDYVIDATHPYATEVTRNVRRACQTVGARYFRLKRPEIAEVSGALYVPDADAAAERLAGNSDKAFLTVGSKELERFTMVPNYSERLFIRILPMPASLQKAHDLGFRMSNIICMQGPFDVDMNILTLKMTGAQYLVTKDSGDAGGFESKIAAARTVGCKIIVIRRPVKEDGYTYDEILSIVMGGGTSYEQKN